MKTIIIIIALFLSLGCARQLVKDPAIPPIDLNLKRVETLICGNHSAGENGCVFTLGEVNSDLKIFKVYSGEIYITGCDIEKTYKYEYSESDPWLSIKLPEKIHADCVIGIFQKVIYPGQDKAQFIVRGLMGTVTLGTCPPNVKCYWSSHQIRYGDIAPSISFSGKGSYVLRGCGEELIPPTQFSGNVSINLTDFLSRIKPVIGECLFIAGVRSEQLKKIYKKINIYSNLAENVKSPVLEKSGKYIKYTGDSKMAVSYINNKMVPASYGKFLPSESGDTLRFYSTSGRSLIVFVKDGRIVWEM